MTLEDWKAKLATEDEALRRQAWRTNAPVRVTAEVFSYEIEAWHADMDAKQRDLDEHDYGGKR